MPSRFFLYTLQNPYVDIDESYIREQKKGMLHPIVPTHRNTASPLIRLLQRRPHLRSNILQHLDERVENRSGDAFAPASRLVHGGVDAGLEIRAGFLGRAERVDDGCGGFGDRDAGGLGVGVGGEFLVVVNGEVSLRVRRLALRWDAGEECLENVHGGGGKMWVLVRGKV